RMPDAMRDAFARAFVGLDTAVGLEFDRADRTARARAQNLINGFASTMRSIGATATRLGRGVLSGLGVNLDVGTLIGKGVAVETAAIDLTNRGFQAQGRRATTADAKATESDIRSAADANKLDAERSAGLPSLWSWCSAGGFVLAPWVTGGGA